MPGGVLKHNPELLTVADVATRLSVSSKTVRRYIASGRLTGYRVGVHLIRVDPIEVEALLRPIPNARTSRGDAA